MLDPETACEGTKGVVSAIGQTPLDGSTHPSWEVPFESEDFFWTARMVPSDTTQDSEGQMCQLLEQYEALLAREGMSIAGNCLRTWIFVRDIDDNYAGVVKGRREYFEKIGLTADTHFIASTGIAGDAADPAVLVTMDAFAVRDIDHSKVRYLKALEHLNPTHEYGVTFERGTLFEHKGIRHIFISGTASIDSSGEVLHLGDPARQASRALKNIRALLADGGASMDDISYFIVYLRNPEDAADVAEVLQDEVPHIKYTMVHAPVCRPAWLVEIECML